MSGPDFWPKSYAKPADDAASVPAIDNTVKLGRMNADGTIEYTGTEPAFPTEAERKADDKKTNWIFQHHPRVKVQRVDWDEIWPSIEQRMRDNPSVDAQTLAGYYGVPYLELHIRMAEWKKANVKGDDVLTEKRTMTKYTQEERLEMARQIKDLLASGDSKYGAALRLGIAPGNADRWLKELAKVELEEYDKREAESEQAEIENMTTHLVAVDNGGEFAWDEADKARTAPAPANNDLTLDDLKAQWCEETLRLMKIPAGERLAIVVQIAAIGG